MSNHRDHRIRVKNVFRVIKTGTSGTAEPNWALAPNAGDRLVEGSCIWENTGSVTVQCETCQRPLTAEEYDQIRTGLRPIWTRGK
jgi:hypothetical protein